MAHTIGQNHFFSPSFPASIPPTMPPKVSPIKPTVPFAKPKSTGVRPSPPSEFGRRRNVAVIFVSIASGSL